MAKVARGVTRKCSTGKILMVMDLKFKHQLKLAKI